MNDTINIKKRLNRRRNFLKRVQRVNDIYTREHNKGKSSGYIYKTYIEPEFNIARSTFYEYLTIPVNKELKKLDEITE